MSNEKKKLNKEWGIKMSIERREKEIKGKERERGKSIERWKI